MQSRTAHTLLSRTQFETRILVPPSGGTGLCSPLASRVLALGKERIVLGYRFLAVPSVSWIVWGARGDVRGALQCAFLVAFWEYLPAFGKQINDCFVYPALRFSYIVVLLATLSGGALRGRGIPSKYHSFDEMTQVIKSLSSTYREIVKTESLGKTLKGRDIWLITLRKGDPDQPRAMLVVGGVDAIQVAGSEMALRFAEHLAKSYGKVDSVTKLLQTTTVYIIPRVSPDAMEAYFQKPLRERSMNYAAADADHDGLVDEDDVDDLNNGGMILRGPGAQTDLRTYSPLDIQTYDFLGKLGEEMLPGYRYIIIYKDLYTVYGGEIDWFYGARGIVTFSNELWTNFDYFRRQREEGEGPRDRGMLYRFDKVLLFEEGVVPWKKFNHPQFGEIEIGGFKKAWTRTAPSFMIEDTCHRNMAFTLFHLYHTPMVEVENVPGMNAVYLRWIVRGSGPFTVTIDSEKGGISSLKSK